MKTFLPGIHMDEFYLIWKRNAGTIQNKWIVFTKPIQYNYQDYDCIAGQFFATVVKQKRFNVLGYIFCLLTISFWRKQEPNHYLAKAGKVNR